MIRPIDYLTPTEGLIQTDFFPTFLMCKHNSGFKISNPHRSCMEEMLEKGQLNTTQSLIDFM